MSTPADPDVESFLLLLAARRSPRTVDAYRRDLAAFGATIDGPNGRTTTEQIEAWLAAMRADGRAPATIARRLAAVRAYLRHLMLVGTRTDNPAAPIAGPRRPKTVPRTLSPSEAERLVEAASGTSPRAMRDRALVELLYGAGLRISEALSLTGNVDVADDLVQETLVKAWTNFDTFQQGTNLRAWLFTILRNHFRSEYRKRRREVDDAAGLDLGLAHPARVLHRARLAVPLDEVQVLDDDALLDGVGLDDAPLLAAVLAGEHLNQVALANFHCACHLAVTS